MVQKSRHGEACLGTCSIYLMPILYRTIVCGEHQGHRVGMWPHVTLETLFLISKTCPFHWAMSQGLAMRPGLPFCCLCSRRSHQNAIGLMEGLIVSTRKETSRGFLLRFSDGRAGLQAWPKFKKQEDLNHTF